MRNLTAEAELQRLSERQSLALQKADAELCAAATLQARLDAVTAERDELRQQNIRLRREYAELLTEVDEVEETVDA